MVLPLKRLIDPISPFVLPTPTDYQVATGVGTLTTGTYKYRITALDAAGHETLASPEMSVALTGPAGGNPQWLLVPGASSYNVYGRISGAEQLIANVPGTQNQYVDSGAITPSGALPTSTTFAEATATPGLYVCPSGATARLEKIVVSNPTAAQGQVFLSVVPAGGTGGAANRVLAGAPVPPDALNGPTQWATGLVLAAGDFITGYVTQPGMTITAFGVVA